jgi:tetratricopeptide (TPR) repeat protein
MKPSQYELPKFKNESDFETFCLDLFKAVFEDSSGKKYGRKGQAQHGIDLYFADFPQAKKAVQCKVRSDKLTLADIQEDLEKFKEFPHEGYEIIFATTANRDKNLQDDCLKINTQIYAWEDLLELLDSNLDIFHRYFISDEQKKYFNISTIIDLANNYYDDLQIDSALNLLEKIDKHFDTLSKEFQYQVSLLKAKIFETKNTFSADSSIRDEIANYHLKVTEYCEGSSIEKHLSKAKAYFTMNESKKGLNELEVVLALDAENEKAINLKITNLNNEQELNTFLDTIDPLLKVKPAYKASLAVFYFKNKNYDKAKELLTEALRSPKIKELEKLRFKELLYLCIFFSESLVPEKELSDQVINNLQNLISQIQDLWGTIKDKEISKYFSHILLPEIDARTSLLTRIQEEQELNEALRSILSVCDKGLEKCLADSYPANRFNYQKAKIYLDLQEYNKAYELISSVNLKLLPDAEIILAVAKFKIGNFIDSQARFKKLLNNEFTREEYKTEAEQTYHKLFNIRSLLESAYFLKMTEPTEENERRLLKLIYGDPERHQHIEQLNSSIDKTVVKENVAVKIKMDSGAEEFFILETNKKIPSGNKVYHPEHRLFKELLEKKIGDEFIVDRNHIPEKKGIIEDILLKYYAVADYDEFNRKYPDRPCGISATLPDNPTLDDLENMLEAVTERLNRN